MSISRSSGQKSRRTAKPAAALPPRYVVVPATMVKSTTSKSARASGTISDISFQDGNIVIRGGVVAKELFNWCQNNHGPNDPCQKHLQPTTKSAGARVPSRHAKRIHSALLVISNPDLLVNGKC